jgi:hypothetical protein
VSVVRWLLALSVASLLCACAHDPNRNDSVNPGSLKVTDKQAVAVVGLAIGNPGGSAQPIQAAWIMVDGQTGRRVGLGTWWEWAACSGWRAPINRLGSFTDACDGGAQYAAFQLEPGTYALGWIVDQRSYFGATDFAQVRLTTVTHGYTRGGSTVTASEAGQIRRDSPRFTVRPGEVVYVGDVVVDFTNPSRLTWTLHVDESQARQFMVSSGLGDRMAVRPWTTLCGIPQGATKRDPLP